MYERICQRRDLCLCRLRQLQNIHSHGKSHPELRWTDTDLGRDPSHLGRRTSLNLTARSSITFNSMRILEASSSETRFSMLVGCLFVQSEFLQLTIYQWRMPQLLHSCCQPRLISKIISLPKATARSPSVILPPTQGHFDPCCRTIWSAAKIRSNAWISTL